MKSFFGFPGNSGWSRSSLLICSSVYRVIGLLDWLDGRVPGTDAMRR
jgi:hypothetical protein